MFLPKAAFGGPGSSPEYSAGPRKGCRLVKEVGQTSRCAVILKNHWFLQRVVNPSLGHKAVKDWGKLGSWCWPPALSRSELNIAAVNKHLPCRSFSLAGVVFRICQALELFTQISLYIIRVQCF